MGVCSKENKKADPELNNNNRIFEEKNEIIITENQKILKENNNDEKLKSNNTINNNDLKIELYPEKYPRYNFKKEPIKNILTKDTLGYSFNSNDEYAFINSNVPLLNGFYTAHTNHYPIRIKPDDIWLLIVQAFSNHVNSNAEKLRKYFVDFDGKKTLMVNYNLNSIEDINKEILENFSEQINKQMKQYLGEELVDNLTPNFSTSTYDSKIIGKLSIMGAFKKYFEYKMTIMGCGIPYIILEGVAEDYKKIKETC